MVIRDAFTVDAPADRVWELLQDVPRMGRLVPGVRRVEQRSPDVFEGELEVRLGPIQSTFRGQVQVLERVPLERIVAEVEGEDRASRTSVRAHFTGELLPANGETRMEYTVELALRGRLAQFGTAVITATAKKMTAEFARKFKDELEA